MAKKGGSHVRKEHGKYVALNKTGGMLPGGKHTTRKKAAKQVQAVYLSQHGLSNKG